MKRLVPGGFHHIRYGTTSIEFEVVYSARKTLAISVFPDRAVMVKAPEGAPFAHIEETVQRRAGWILKQRRTFEA
ncbi:MAG: YgjP-like metallopeptidase domain-containing protein, partial [Chloroflexota bacterium]|nr:YgjP-like metallopeptidase domain-containing protein [Chloroflexota bacterium]